jgi:hypothetical protein
VRCSPASKAVFPAALSALRLATRCDIGEEAGPNGISQEELAIREQRSTSSNPVRDHLASKFAATESARFSSWQIKHVDAEMTP